jgi:hypothetical protein
MFCWPLKPPEEHTWLVVRDSQLLLEKGLSKRAHRVLVLELASSTLGSNGYTGIERRADWTFKVPGPTLNLPWHAPHFSLPICQISPLTDPNLDHFITMVVISCQVNIIATQKWGEMAQ